MVHSLVQSGAFAVARTSSLARLAVTYLTLRAAELAARAFRDPEDQRRFVSQVRSTLADQIERGEPLQPVRLRDPAQQQRNSREAERAVARS
jgi:hypothetical protein